MMGIITTGLIEKRHSARDLKSYEMIEEAFSTSNLSVFDKLEAFPRFVSKRSLARLLVRYEIYKQILDINGIIVECGVFNGAGLFTWAQLANIFEPTNYPRKIVGFDTFEGFPDVDVSDCNGDLAPKAGDVRGASYNEFQISLDKYNMERHLSHINNVELVKGDFTATGEQYLNDNKQTLVALLYLDFDLYEPTKRALEVFLPRMSKGAIICFDELNCSNFPGETLALLDMMDIKKYEIQRMTIDPWISYIKL